jgi:beta-glucosidase
MYQPLPRIRQTKALNTQQLLTHAQNSKTQNGVLKGELGYHGFVVSDWGAQHAGVAIALSDLEMVMPCGEESWASNLT